MNGRRDLRDDGVRPGARSGGPRARAGSTRTGASFGHFIGGGFVAAARRALRQHQSRHRRRRSRRVAQAGAGRRRRRGRRPRARAFPAWAALVGPRARALPLRARAPGPEARAAARRARDARQRQADPRDARHRHPAGRAPLLPPRRLGAAAWSASSPAIAPVGVVGQIIPWNFPLLMLAWKIAPALAAGNTRGAEARRVHAAHRARCSPRSAPRRGLPPGVVNIVTGDGATGAALVDHPDVDKIAFTGSTEVGRAHPPRDRGHAARSSRSSSAASRPFIVFDDADLDSVVEGVVDAIWFNQGQVCCAGSRLLVQEAIAEQLDRQAARAHGDAARRRPARQGDRHRRDRGAGPARADPEAGGAGRRGGRDAVAAVVGLPEGGLLLSADAAHRRRSRRRPSRRSRSSGRCWWR